MGSTFFLTPRQEFDVGALRAELLSFEGVLPDPTDPDGVVVAESAHAVQQAVDSLSKNPSENPWTIFVHLDPAQIQVSREATQPVLDYFRPILKRVLLAGTGSVTDDEGRKIPMDVGGGIDLYLLR